MKINKLNYEVYLIDYVEGLLSEQDSKGFELFLEKHPEIRHDISDYLEAPVLAENESIVFENKKALLKTTMRYSWLVLIPLVGGLIYLAHSYNSKSKTKPLYKIEQTDFSTEIAAQETEVRQSETSELDQQERPAEYIAEPKKRMVKNKTITLPKSVRPSAKLAESSNERAVIPEEVVKEKKTTSAALAITSPVEQLERPHLLEPMTSIDILRPTIDLSQPDNSESFVAIGKALAIEMAYRSLDNQTSTKDKIWKLITPQAYKDLNIRSTVSSQSLKSATVDSDIDIAPQNFFTN